jgi:indole-3-glycerol phosphate synthase
MTTVLEKIVVNKRLEIEEQKILLPLDILKQQLPERQIGMFKAALQDQTQVNIIAEIKRSSPSKGIMTEDFDPVALAGSYRDGGAAALSVLTEQRYFLGRQEYMGLARNESGLPVLCKDFIIDPYQVYLARVWQADALLLIVSLHTADSLREFLALGKEIGLDCLVEVHNEKELETALVAGADLIGVNNRNLEDFTVDLGRSERLARLIPPGVIRVAESGIFVADDIRRLRDSGYNNFLIGEALVKAENPSELISQLRNA